VIFERVFVTTLVLSCLAPAAAHDSPTAAALDRNVGILAANEWLSQPTDDGVTVSVIPGRSMELMAEVWPRAGGRLRRTAPLQAEAERLAAIRIDGLEPGTEYGYRLVYRVPAARDGRERSARPPLAARPPHQFRTAPEPGTSFRFGFLTDSHLIFRWKRSRCGGSREGFEVFLGTLRNAASRDLDFVVLGGDEAQTHRAGKGECRFRGQPFGRGTANTRAEANRRYLLVRRAYEPLAARVPIHYVLGNHEGEAGFERPPAMSSHSDHLTRISRRARLAHLPNPHPVHGGGEDGSYFALRWGDVLILALDVMGYTTRVPKSPSDWTLGSEQMEWLERTLAGSEVPWKIVIAHHLVGGVPKVRPRYHYGRGGALSTEDGTASGRFLGEQERIHQLMKRHGAQLFLYGHDHLFSIAQKLDPDGASSGVFYACGGTSAGTGAAWRGASRIERGYRRPEDPSTPLTYDPGFTEITVRGGEELILRYVVTDLDDPRRNATVLHEERIRRPR
jgi:hypothetical protein